MKKKRVEKPRREHRRECDGRSFEVAEVRRRHPALSGARNCPRHFVARQSPCCSRL